jgi:heterogeneous nuclear rnp K-like protein
MAESTEPSAQASEPREDAGVVASAAAEQNGEEQAAAADADADAADAGDMPAMNASLRALIVSADASIIIGKQGKHINEVREKSGARLAIVSAGHQTTHPAHNVRFRNFTDIRMSSQSQSVQGNPERIMTVSGPLDAVSKVCAAVSGERFEIRRKLIGPDLFDRHSG